MKKIIFIFIILFIFVGIVNCNAEVYDFNAGNDVLLLNDETSVDNVFEVEDVNDKSCDSLGSFKDDLQNIFNAFKIVAPILTLVLSSFEYLTTVMNKDIDGSMKKTNKRFVTRLILVLLLYFIPTILNLLLGIVFDGAGTCIS